MIGFSGTAVTTFFTTGAAAFFAMGGSCREGTQSRPILGTVFTSRSPIRRVSPVPAKHRCALRKGRPVDCARLSRLNS
jgi:hypothetical protein